MYRMDEGLHGGGGGTGARRWLDLPDAERGLLWCARMLIISWPRSARVSATLLAAYGETALGVEHLLRCWLSQLTRRSRRVIEIGRPCASLVTPDEAAMLRALRAAADGDDDGAAQALAAVCPAEAVGGMLPLVRCLAAHAL